MALFEPFIDTVVICTLTALVIGLAVLALLVALCVRLYERYGTFDVTEMRRLRG